MCTSFFAANHGPRCVGRARERFDLTRDLGETLKKKHWAFGKGIHYCMGALR